MAKQFKQDQEVKVASAYRGKILGKDWNNDSLYRVELLEGPQKGKVISYTVDMLK
jgi:hypothetical protein